MKIKWSFSVEGTRIGDGGVHSVHSVHSDHPPTPASGLPQGVPRNTVRQPLVSEKEEGSQANGCCSFPKSVL